uniref:Uncharacterized protein n=1 Tax=candidate division CPR3 bacterium TaxID=2268181 RepID=A0A7C4R308_UNCC3
MFIDKIKTKAFITTINLVIFLGILGISIRPACWDFERRFSIVSFLFPEERMLLKICDEPEKIIVKLPIEGLVIFFIFLVVRNHSVVYKCSLK